MDWIPVKNSLPNAHEPVLVLMEANESYKQFNHMHIAYLSETGWVGKDITLPNVTHWLPLPPAPDNAHFEAIKGAADSVVSNYVPEDAAVQKFSFEIIVDSQPYNVHYHKAPDGYWEFNTYH